MPFALRATAFYFAAAVTGACVAVFYTILLEEENWLVIPVLVCGDLLSPALGGWLSLRQSDYWVFPVAILMAWFITVLTEIEYGSLRFTTQSYFEVADTVFGSSVLDVIVLHGLLAFLFFWIGRRARRLIPPRAPPEAAEEGSPEQDDS